MTRAKNAMQKDMGVIRIGTSPMNPAQVLREILAHTVQKFLSATQTVLQVRLITQR